MNVQPLPFPATRRSGFFLQPVSCGILALAGVLTLSASALSAQFDPNNPIPEVIQHGPLRVDLRPVVSGLVSPVALLSAPDGSKRSFIVEQTGKIWVVKNGKRLATPLIDLASRMVTLNTAYDERGLLGLAFDPGFANPQSPGFGRVFTYCSEPVAGTADFPDPYATTLNHQGVVASWRVSATDPDVIDPATRVEILRVDEPQSNHNGGTIAFGPDGYLYFGLGDGGGANDNNPNGHNPATGNGQDPMIALGKMLRIDVNGTNSANGKYGIPPTNPYSAPNGLPEIYALGFRNPYRFSFDGADLLVADVGQNEVEELDRVELGKNYGWNHKEGTFKFNTEGTVSDDLTGVPAGLTDPIFQYDHTEGTSITGGFVYRGNAIPELRGKYVFADFSGSFTAPTGRLFYADLATGEIREFILGNDDAPLGLYAKSIGVDADGEIYLLGSTVLGPTGTTGVVMKLVPPLLYTKGAPVPQAGVNGSGIPAGAVFQTFGVPSINAAGELAYVARYTSPEGNRSVVLGPKSDDRSTFAVLIGAGDAAPNASGEPLAGARVFASFSDPVLNGDGHVAFLARLKSAVATDSGIWTNADAGTLHLVAREGDEAPGVAGAHFKNFSSVVLGDGGANASTLAFTATLSQPRSINAANDGGLWLSHGGAAPELVLREKQTLNVRGSDLTVKSFRALTILNGASGQGHGEAQGSVLAQVSFTNGTQAVLQFSGSTSFTTVAASGDPILDAALKSFASVTQSAEAHPAFVGNLQSASDPRDAAVMVQADDLALQPVADKGSPAAGTDAVFSSFSTVVNGGDAGVAFLANVSGGTTTGATNTGLWWKQGATLSLLAREGSPAADVAGAKWSAFKSLALPEGPGAGPLVVADLRTGGDVTAANKTGLWAADASGILHLVLRTGTPLQVGSNPRKLRSFTVLGVVPGSPAQTRSYNSSRQLVYRAFLTDGSQAVLSTKLP